MIQLLDHWRSDGILHYRHVQAKPVLRNFAMLHDVPNFENPQAGTAEEAT
jgi:hypothetical protein